MAKVNAITRLAIGLPEGLATGLAIWLVIRAIYSLLPGVPGEEGFWELVGRREARRKAGSGGQGAPGSARAATRGDRE